MIHISDSAKKHFVKLLKTQKAGTNIRMFVVNHDNENIEYGISYCLDKTIKEHDISLKYEKFTIYIDKQSAPYLKNMEIDLIKDQLNSQLVFKKSDVEIKKINDHSLLIENIKHILKSKINPQLANHGGHVSLVRITQDGFAVLQFSGSCSSCEMINFTLKEGIEKQLLKECPELKGVYNFDYL